jgi:hypothetical protein
LTDPEHVDPETSLPPPPEDEALAAPIDDPIPVPDDGLGEWPTHGGPLGCLVSTMIGCVLAGFLASTSISFVHFTKAGGWFILGAVIVMLSGLALFGWAGWSLGKRVYREYAPSQRQLRYQERLREQPRSSS